MKKIVSQDGKESAEGSEISAETKRNRAAITFYQHKEEKDRKSVTLH